MRTLLQTALTLALSAPALATDAPTPAPDLEIRGLLSAEEFQIGRAHV